MNVETCKMSLLNFDILLMYSYFMIVFEFVSWDKEVVSVRDCCNTCTVINVSVHFCTKVCVLGIEPCDGNSAVGNMLRGWEINLWCMSILWLALICLNETCSKGQIIIILSDMFSIQRDHNQEICLSPLIFICALETLGRSKKLWSDWNWLGPFYVLLTVHLGSVLVNNHFDAQFFFCIYLFQFSASFEHPCAHRQENNLCYYDI
jgi:hypothetical protein